MVLIVAFMAAMVGSTALLAYTIYEQKQTYPIGALPLQAEKKIIYAFFICCFTLVWSSTWMANRRMNRLTSAHDWLVNAVSSNIENLKQAVQVHDDYLDLVHKHDHEIIYEPLEYKDGAENLEAVEAPLLTEVSAKAVEKPSLHWPWGDHHTETLGHLEAAAHHFWRLYDPDDIGTAPTNDMVESWLQDKRGRSKSKAKAIASMIRPDGLPTGPRR